MDQDHLPEFSSFPCRHLEIFEITTFAASKHNSAAYVAVAASVGWLSELSEPHGDKAIGPERWLFVRAGKMTRLDH